MSRGAIGAWRPGAASLARPARIAVAAIVAAVALSGCSGAPAWQFAERPGVPVHLDLRYGGGIDGSLVGFEEGSLVVDHAVPKSEALEVVRMDGRDVVYVSGVPVGEAVEVRDFDVVVREKLFASEYEDARVRSRAYVGWGTAIAAVLGFFLVQLLEEEL
jgi:hypothetical protein